MLGRSSPATNTCTRKAIAQFYCTFQASAVKSDALTGTTTQSYEIKLLLFTWNPSPLRPSKFSFDYLLLPPRSALGIVSPRLMPKAPSQAPMPAHPLTHHNCSNGWVSVTRLCAIHCRGQSIRQVSCYISLSGFRLP